VTPASFTAWRDALGGRRFLMSMGAHLVNTLLFLHGVLSESGYLMTFGSTVAVYVGANVTQRFIEKRNATT